jgi:hypothetical protein
MNEIVDITYRDGFLVVSGEIAPSVFRLGIAIPHCDMPILVLEIVIMVWFRQSSTHQLCLHAMLRRSPKTD